VRQRRCWHGFTGAQVSFPFLHRATQTAASQLHALAGHLAMCTSTHDRCTLMNSLSVAQEAHLCGLGREHSNLGRHKTEHWHTCRCRWPQKSSPTGRDQWSCETGVEAALVARRAACFMVPARPRWRRWAVGGPLSGRVLTAALSPRLYAGRKKVFCANLK